MYFNKEGISLYYEKHGNGPKKVLILPGWGETRPTFYNMINILQQFYTVYIIDYPGFGNSTWPSTDLTIYDYTNIIRNFMEEENIKNPIIIAHSFGGRITTLLTGYYKERVDKLILIDAATIKHRKHILQIIKEKTYKLLKKCKFFLPKSKRCAYQNKLLNLFGSSDYKSLNKEMMKSFRNIISEDLSPYLPYIDSETLLLWGKKDIDTPLKDGVKMNKKIKDSYLVVFENGSHFSYLEYPVQTINIILNFIENEKD